MPEPVVDPPLPPLVPLKVVALLVLEPVTFVAALVLAVVELAETLVLAAREGVTVFELEFEPPQAASPPADRIAMPRNQTPA